jgi:hypothetical protein
MSQKSSGKRFSAFYNQRGTAEQYIKEGKNAIRWTRLSCRKFRHNAVRLQAKVGEITMANELLYAKIDKLEGGRPFARRRSRT